MVSPTAEYTTVHHIFTEAYFALGEYTRTLRLISELIELRVGYAQRIRRAELDEPPLFLLRKRGETALHLSYGGISKRS